MITRILVYTYGRNSHQQTINAAAQLASQHNAELIGLFVQPEIANYASVYGQYPLNLTQVFNELQSDYKKKARQEFLDILTSYDCSHQWHESEQYEAQPRPSLYADYIFVSQPNENSDLSINDMDFIDRILTHSGIPTVIVPNTWEAKSFAVQPMLGWKESREAAGVVRLTLPLMRSAESVDIVTVIKEQQDEQDLVEGIEICNYLSGHQVECEYFAEQMLPSDQNEAATLLRHARSRSRDLIVAGGYSHSRFREIILGGVTRALIQQSSLPVLLAH